MMRLPASPAPFIAATTSSLAAGCLSCSMKTLPSLVTLTKSGSGAFSVLFTAACLALGNSTLLPRWSMGVTTMKMMRSTSTTSTSGVMLMSERTPPLVPTSMLMASGLRSRGGRAGRLHAGVGERLVEAALLEEEVHQLVGGVGDVHRHLLHAVGEVVEHHQRGDGDEQAEGGGDERLRDAGGHRGEAARAGGGHQLE